MHLDERPKSEGESQETQVLTGLESSLDGLSVSERSDKQLSVSERSDKELADLECSISRIKLKDEDKADNVRESQEKEDTAKVQEEEEVSAAEPSASEVSSEKDDADLIVKVEKEGEEKDSEAVTSSEDQEESTSQCSQLPVGKSDETGIDDSSLGKEKKGSTSDEESVKADSDVKETIEKNDEKRDEQLLEATGRDKKTSDGKPTKEPKKHLSRGLTSGPSDPHYYPYSHQNANCYADSSPLYQQQASPLSAMTPTHYGMAMSPGSAYADSYTLGVSPAISWTPESPCSYDDPSVYQTTETFDTSLSVFPETTSLMGGAGEFKPQESQDTPHNMSEILRVIQNIGEGNQSDQYVDAERVAEIKMELIRSLKDVNLENDMTAEQGMLNFLEQERFAEPQNQMYMPVFHEMENEVTSEQEMRNRMDPERLAKAQRRTAKRSDERLYEKDFQGDTDAMIVSCQPEHSESFLENLYAIIQKVKTIKLCCDVAVNGRCNRCGNDDWSTFYSPLSIPNTQGHCVLSAALIYHHNEKSQNTNLIVRFIYDAISENQADVQRIMNMEMASIYRHFAAIYPVLRGLVPDM